jgi:hypothetical protein
MPHPFRTAIEAEDYQAAVALLADDVAFHSPAVYKAYQGKKIVSGLLFAVSKVFADFHYTDELGDGHTTCLVFKARVGDKDVEGMDLMRHNGAGQIVDFTVMVRPLSGLQALAAAMQAALGPKD